MALGDEFAHAYRDSDGITLEEDGCYDTPYDENAPVDVSIPDFS